MFHAFPLLMPWVDASQRVYRAVGDFVTKQLDHAHARRNRDDHR
jgi:hypothetical protein